jgi:uncharacterized protein (UPF0212 family)
MLADRLQRRLEPPIWEEKGSIKLSSTHVLQVIETVDELMSSTVSKMAKFFGNSSKFLNVESCLQYGHVNKNPFWVWASELAIVEMQTRHKECPQCNTWALF